MVSHWFNMLKKFKNNQGLFRKTDLGVWKQFVGRSAKFLKLNKTYDYFICIEIQCYSDIFLAS